MKHFIAAVIMCTATSAAADSFAWQFNGQPIGCERPKQVRILAIVALYSEIVTLPFGCHSVDPATGTLGGLKRINEHELMARILYRKFVRTTGPELYVLVQIKPLKELGKLL